MRLSEQRGLTLVECVVAAAVLLTGWTAVAGTLAMSVRAVAGGRHLTQGELVVTDCCERLRSLPFAVSRLPVGQDAPDNVVDEVFPWATTQCNRDTAFYCPQARAGRPPATFFTTSRVGEVDVQTAATFVSSTRAGWRPADPGLVDGFRSHVGGGPPSEALTVVVSASWSDQGHTHELAQTMVLEDRQAPTSRFDDAAGGTPGTAP